MMPGSWEMQEKVVQQTFNSLYLSKFAKTNKIMAHLLPASDELLVLGIFKYKNPAPALNCIDSCCIVFQVVFLPLSTQEFFFTYAISSPKVQ